MDLYAIYAVRSQTLIVSMDIISLILGIIVWEHYRGDDGVFERLTISHMIIDASGTLFNASIHHIWTKYERRKEYILARISQIVSLVICVTTSLITIFNYPDEYIHNESALANYIIIKILQYHLKIFPIFEYIAMVFV